jgi:hypothetical protein
MRTVLFTRNPAARAPGVPLPFGSSSIAAISAIATGGRPGATGRSTADATIERCFNRLKGFRGIANRYDCEDDAAVSVG